MMKKDVNSLLPRYFERKCLAWFSFQSSSDLHIVCFLYYLSLSECYVLKIYVLALFSYFESNMAKIMTNMVFSWLWIVFIGSDMSCRLSKTKMTNEMTYFGLINANLRTVLGSPGFKVFFNYCLLYSMKTTIKISLTIRI
jgi:hypothetical protein